MEIQRVKGNTFCIDTKIAYIPFYKIDHEKIILLDTGVKSCRKELENLLEKNHLQVVGVLCSHSHADHIGNTAYFKKKYHCKVAMAEGEAWTCESLSNLKIYYNSHALPIVKKRYGYLIFHADILMTQKQQCIDFCGINFQMIHTPGHSPNHISIITPDNVLYVGDALISYEVMKGAKMPYVFMLKQDLESKRKLQNLNCSKYIIAHKGIYNDISKLIEDNIKFYQYRAQRIKNLIEGTMTREKIFTAVVESFHIPMKDIFKHDIIERTLKSYLDYLVEIDEIELILEERLLKYRKRI